MVEVSSTDALRYSRAMRNRGHLAAMLLCCAMLGACLTKDTEPTPALSADQSGTRALEKICINLLRQVRVDCHAGLTNDQPRAQFRCLDARLKLSNTCF